MNFYKYSLLSTLAVFFVVTILPSAAAQHFEGEMRVTVHDLSEGNTDEFTLFVAENRITIGGSLKEYADFPLLRDALTIRADMNDLLIHSDKTVAVVNLRDIEALIKQMFPAEQREAIQTEDVEGRVRFSETGETRNIHGYATRKMVAYDAENENRETHIWLADINIDWKQLFSPLANLANSMGQGFDFDDMDWPMDKTPLVAEFYEDGELQSKLEISQLVERKLKPGEVDIPADKEAISLFQLMMQQN